MSTLGADVFRVIVHSLTQQSDKSNTNKMDSLLLSSFGNNRIWNVVIVILLNMCLLFLWWFLITIKHKKTLTHPCISQGRPLTWSNICCIKRKQGEHIRKCSRRALCVLKKIQLPKKCSGWTLAGKKKTKKKTPLKHNWGPWRTAVLTLLEVTICSRVADPRCTAMWKPRI